MFSSIASTQRVPSRVTPSEVRPQREFTIRTIVHQGCLFTVVQSDDPYTPIKVALKHATKQESVCARQILEQEACFLKHLRNRYTQRLHGLFQNGQGSLQLATHWIHGVSLDEWIACRPSRLGDCPFNPEIHRTESRESMQCLLDAAFSIRFAHRRMIMHCDVKPANIIHGCDGRGTMIDWGSGTWKSRPKTDGYTGTVTHMSPEQAACERISDKSDVFGLAASLYNVLTGKPPYGAETLHLTLIQAQERDFCPLRDSNPHVPKELARLCENCMQRNPDRRPPVRHFINVLMSVLRNMS